MSNVQPVVLSVVDAGTYLSVSTDTVRRLVRSGAVPHIRVGNSIRIHRSDLDEYLDSRRSTSWNPVDGRGNPKLAIA